MLRAMIAMSGGVDSSAAALLMKRSGYDCAGVTMRLYRSPGMERESPRNCCSDADEEDAAYVCWQLGIPFESLCCTREFESTVIKNFIREYEVGRTPNPCIVCNRRMKFELLLELARERGFDCLATGHYARITQDRDSNRWQLRKARDESKDQSYVLYMLTQEQLAFLRFPLGELSKAEVRAVAESAGLVTASKHESQDICFIPDGDYGAFLERWTGHCDPDGEILDLEGRVVGRHRGAVRYTIGQRRGLSVAAEQPLYVVTKDMEKHTVTIGPESALYSRELIASDFNWLSIPEPEHPLRATARTRYRQQENPATVWPLEGSRVRLVFDQPQRAVTPGQAVVLYDGDLVLGGGTIEQVHSGQ
ncbi:MAG: tRNA 2-thiouridine(34) synthase MnmA [Eubacteriales bacterium]|nr:tRNA 2-thiouridine(34) synthase MnmA [Eubacteriales bacterium]